MAFYKRSVFLVNPTFQLKICFLVCIVILISTLIYPIIIYDFFLMVSSLSKELSKDIVAARNELIAYLIFIQAVITVIVFIVFVFVTHKIAGPLFKLKEHLRIIREGGPITPLTFRQGDHFQDVAEEVTLFLEAIQIKQENDFEYLDEVSLYISNLSTVVPDDKKPILNEISRRLIEIKSRHKN